MENKVHCVANLCLGVSRTDFPEFQGLEKHVITELSALSDKVTMDLGRFGSPTLTLTPYEKPVLPGEDRIAAYYRRWIRVEVDAHCSGTEILVRDRDGYVYESDSEDQSMELLVLKLAKRVTDLVVIANVAYPGAFDCEGGEATVNGRHGFTVPRLSCTRLKQAVRTCMKTEWPPLIDVELDQVYRWATRQKGFRTGMSDGPTSRALNALANLMEASDPMDMFWAMVGIEALYVRGHEDNLQQIREKTEALFRKPEGFKNALRDMYNFRSRLIHGDLDFPGPLADDLFGVCTGKYYKDMDEAVSMAALVLVATFQEMVKRDCDEIDFRKVYEPVGTHGDSVIPT